MGEPSPFPPPLPGWYQDTDGTPRYFDGARWTEHSMSRLPLDERTELLQRAVSSAVSRGARVESQTQTAAIVVWGRPVNHVLHAILSIFTCALWLVIWAIMSSTGGERRQVIEVDPWGKVMESEIRRVV